MYPHFQDQISFFLEHEQISTVKKLHKPIENSPQTER